MIPVKPGIIDEYLGAFEELRSTPSRRFAETTGQLVYSYDNNVIRGNDIEFKPAAMCIGR